MNPIEVVDVLQKCAAFDRRTIGEADAFAWHEILAPFPKADALMAVTAWYRERREMAMPSDVLAEVHKIRRARVHGLSEEDFAPDIGAVHHGAEARGYVDTIRARRSLVLDGMPLADAIAAVPVPDGVPLAIEWTRSEQ